MAKKTRKSKERFKTMHGVFDEFTNKTLFRLIARSYFEGMESPISIGKESNVFTALRKDNTRVVVKIYRLETCDFNRMYDYIVSDPRYPNIKKGRKRKTIFSWVQREFRNILKAREANVSVPTPYGFLNNVLVLEFIGRGNMAAPQLKDKAPKNPENFLNKIIENMIKLHQAGLVHGDLSEFNILNHNENPVFIDFSQATVKQHTAFADYLNRDIKNICRFFRKIGYNAEEEKTQKKIILDHLEQNL